MDGPPVQALTAGSPPEIQKAIDTWAVQRKVTAARQLAYLFDDNNSFAAAVGLQPNQTADLWQAFEGHSKAWAAFRYHETLASLAHEPRFSILPARPVHAYQPAAASTARKKAKTIKNSSAPSHDPPPAPGTGPEVHKKYTADPAVIEHLWDLMRALGPEGAHHSDLEAHQANLQSFKDVWLKRFEDIDASGMRARWGQWKAWCKWGGKRSPPVAPYPVLTGLLGEWLKKKSEGGPTAAPAALSSLCWVAKHTGLRMPDGSLLQPWKKVPLGHAPVQAVAYPLRVIAHFDVLSRASNVYVAHVAAGCRLRCGSGLRPEHIQRSLLVRCTDCMVVGVCRLGKPRVDGQRSGFPWVCPRTSLALGAVDDFPMALREPEKVFAEVEHTWLVWEWGPAKADLSQASCWLPKACSRLTEAERQLLQMPPLCLDAAEAAKFQCRSARRGLASAATRFGLKPPEVAALGNWRGVLPTESKTRQEAAAICGSMAVRYDQGRLLLSAKAGQMVSEGLRLAVRAAGHWNLEWDEIDTVAPPRSELKKAVTGFGKGLLAVLEESLPVVPNLCLPMPEAAGPASAGAKPSGHRGPVNCLKASPASPAESRDASPTTPGADGLGPADSGSESDDQHPLERWAGLRWIAVKKGFLHVILDESGHRCRAACGRYIKGTPCNGLATALADGTEWHPACLDHDPALQEAILEWNRG